MCLNIRLVRNPIIASLSNHLEFYPTPINLSYLWGFGSLAGMALVGQIITGILLAMHYTPEVSLAFASVEHIMRDVVGGVGLRYIHANGASMFFILVYIHMFRGLYYTSYYKPRIILWSSGVIIFFAMMATAFMGYVLPWGQMSFWGATVITNLFSAIPFVGNFIVEWLWGGFSVDNPTLNRFFSLHYLLPFIIVGLVLVHLILLHVNGSNNPLGLNSILDRVSFYPYFYVKDLFGFFLFIIFFSYFVIYSPNLLGHPDNYIEAEPLVTPSHIVPEWYFLPFYAILRTIPDKLGGVIMMVVAILILLVLPLIEFSRFRSPLFKPFHVLLFWAFFGVSLLLGWIGQEPVESPYTDLAVWITLFYFAYFIIFIPMFCNIEFIIISNFSKTMKKLFETKNYMNYSFLLVFMNLENNFEYYTISNAYIVSVFVITFTACILLFSYKKSMGLNFNIHYVHFLFISLFNVLMMSIVKEISIVDVLDYIFGYNDDILKEEINNILSNDASIKNSGVFGPNVPKHHMDFDFKECRMDDPAKVECALRSVEAYNKDMDELLQNNKYFFKEYLLPLEERHDRTRCDKVETAVTKFLNATQRFDDQIVHEIFEKGEKSVGSSVLARFNMYLDDYRVLSQMIYNLSPRGDTTKFRIPNDIVFRLVNTVVFEANDFTATLFLSTGELNIARVGEALNMHNYILTVRDDIPEEGQELEEFRKSLTWTFRGSPITTRACKTYQDRKDFGEYSPEFFENHRRWKYTIVLKKILLENIAEEFSNYLSCKHYEKIHKTISEALKEKTHKEYELFGQIFLRDYDNPAYRLVYSILNAHNIHFLPRSSKAAIHQLFPAKLWVQEAILPESKRNEYISERYNVEVAKPDYFVSIMKNQRTHSRAFIMVENADIAMRTAIQYGNLEMTKSQMSQILCLDQVLRVISIDAARRMVTFNDSSFLCMKIYQIKNPTLRLVVHTFCYYLIMTQDNFNLVRPVLDLPPFEVEFKAYYKQIKELSDNKIPYQEWPYVSKRYACAVNFNITYSTSASVQYLKILGSREKFDEFREICHACVVEESKTNKKIEDLFYFTDYILNFDFLIFICTFLLTCFCYVICYRNYLIENKTLEYGLFLIIAQSCVIFLLKSLNLMSFIISFECISFISYVLISYERRNKFSSRAGIQYLILSGVISGLLFISFSLIYKSLGTVDISFINVIANLKYDIFFFDTVNKLWLKSLNFINFFYYEHLFYSLFISVLLFLISFAFKSVISPFHVWAPSIYANSPLVSTIFLNTFLKFVYFIVLGSLLYFVFFIMHEIWKPCLILFSLSSMFSAVMGAISERLSKKFFIYTSMSHVAFILSGYLCSNNLSFLNANIYLIVYIFSSLSVWFFFLLHPRKLIYVTDFKIFKNNKILTYVFIIFMFSMAGLPPLAGFFIKYNILVSIFSDKYWLLGYVLLFFSVISFFYYLKIMKIIFFEQKHDFNFFHFEFSHIKWKKIILVNILTWFILLYMLLFHFSFYNVIELVECL